MASKGRVKWYNTRLGYGFLEVEGGDDVFVHYTVIQDDDPIKEGDEVEFELGEAPDGRACAINVNKLE